MLGWYVIGMLPGPLLEDALGNPPKDEIEAYVASIKIKQAGLVLPKCSY